MDIRPHSAGRVPGPGLFHMPAEIYHDDPAPEPSLSSSIADLLIHRSPRHAWLAHPRFGSDGIERDPTRAKEIGTAAHKLILGRGTGLVVIDADDYRTAKAKAERADAYADGLCPILAPDLAQAEAMAQAVTAQLAEIPDCEGFADAPSEVVAVVRDPTGAWVRIMMDRVEFRANRVIIWDVKTGDQPAAPQGLGRRVEAMGMEVQAALYVRALATLFPRFAGRVSFRWLFVENEAPQHAIAVAEADNVGMGIGARKVSAALHLWNRCRATKTWPGYPAQILRVEYPEWAANRWTEREEADPTLAGVSYDITQSPWRPVDMGDAA
ncbi:PD-(D/E)XK nuclease family protein [Methylobacterium nodulans]|uniref:PD-(D/E)XK endonuclease-like domain-containing protein n=1 Tax=Methylobacterium nodulans (strain LMG 21967 / CNCM I-2342 / ORS 2060) TaxID=460265 RepID=B8IV52_METNO|nr:PD-(D/E)XK nuclease family protein [Methylobacterium nodulans]ACL59110.1 conserved hypothetical protein [Methylobacterium nodulans ORS 2060]